MANQSSSSTMDKTGTTREPDPSDGVFGSFLTLSMGMVENGIRTSAGVARTVTEEAHKFVDAVIQFGDQANQSVVRTARKLSDSGFSLATDAIGRTEQAALVVLTHGQSTSDRVAELAAQASKAAVGSRGLHRAAATRD